MGYFALTLTFLPLILLLWLANIADKRRQPHPDKHGMTIIVYVLLAGFWLSVLGIAIFVFFMGIAYHHYADIDVMTARYRAQGLDPIMVVKLMQSLPRLGAGTTVLALAGLSLLFPAPRKRIARFIPIHPHSVTHAVALAYGILILLNLWVVTGVGLEVVAGSLQQAPEVPTAELIAMLWLQNGLLTLMALIGVGWPSRRDLHRTFHRLGLLWPSRKQAGIGIGLGLASFLLLLPWTWILDKTGVGLNPNIEKISEQLLGPLTTSIPGIISLGLAAALGEELVYRGALQPRFGIFATALLFSLTHNQYGVSIATLTVFFLGLLLGWSRKHYNTTTSILVHATYNIAIGLSSFLFQ